MKKRVFSQTLLVLFVVTLIMMSPINFTKAALATGEEWKALHFKAGQMFIYELKREDAGMERTGEVTLWIDDGLDEIEMLVEGEFDKVPFSVFAVSEKGDIEDIYINFATALYVHLPPDIRDLLFYTFLSFKTEALYGEELSVGWEYQDEYDTLFRITDKKIFAGREGYLIQIEDEDYSTLEVCINPEVPLPLMANTKGFVEGDQYEGSVFRAVLTSYETDAVAAEVTVADREMEEGILNEVVEHFRNNSLDVGETYMKAYKMMGAVAGFGLEVEGGEVELYLFDPATAAAETVKSLEEARNTGKFWFSAMEMEIPVVINNSILLTGLEYGTFYEHPAKNAIIEIFLDF